MKTYHICYLMSCYGLERELDVLANNKVEAYDKAVYEEIPKVEDGHYPYGAYVNIFRQLKDGKEELLRSNKLYNLLADNEFIGNRSIYDARVIGLTVTLGVVSILIEEA